MISYYDPSLRLHVQFRTEKQKADFLKKYADQDKARLRHLSQIKSMFNYLGK